MQLRLLDFTVFTRTRFRLTGLGDNHLKDDTQFAPEIF